MPETCGHMVYHCNSGQTRFRSKAESKWISGFVFEVSWTWLTWQPYSRCSANNSRSFDSIQENLCKPVLNMSMMTCAEPFVFNSLFLKTNHAWCKKNMQHSNMYYPPIITRSLYFIVTYYPSIMPWISQHFIFDLSTHSSGASQWHHCCIGRLGSEQPYPLRSPHQSKLAPWNRGSNWRE